MERFTPRAMSLMRLYMEEAWRRCLNAKDPLRMAALGNLMRTMRSFEMSTFQEYTFLGVYSGFTKENVLNILTKIVKKEEVELMDLPAWKEVTKHPDLCLEAFSLQRLKCVDEDIHMSQDEIKALIAYNKSSPHGEVRGNVGKSSELYQAITEDEAYQTL